MLGKVFSPPLSLKFEYINLFPKNLNSIVVYITKHRVFALPRCTAAKACMHRITIEDISPRRKTKIHKKPTESPHSCPGPFVLMLILYDFSFLNLIWVTCLSMLTSAYTKHWGHANRISTCGLSSVWVSFSSSRSRFLQTYPGIPLEVERYYPHLTDT